MSYIELSGSFTGPQRGRAQCDRCGRVHSLFGKEFREERMPGQEPTHYCTTLLYECERRTARLEGREPDFTTLREAGVSPLD